VSVVVQQPVYQVGIYSLFFSCIFIFKDHAAAVSDTSASAHELRSSIINGTVRRNGEVHFPATILCRHVTWNQWACSASC
jgi:hypothetical protein